MPDKKHLLSIIIIITISMFAIFIWVTNPRINNQKDAVDRGEQIQQTKNPTDISNTGNQTYTNPAEKEIQPIYTPENPPLPEGIFLWVWPDGVINEDAFRTGPLFSENRIYVTHNLAIEDKAALPVLYINGVEITRDNIIKDEMNPGPFIFSWDFNQGPGVYNAKVVVERLGGQLHLKWLTKTGHEKGQK